MIYNSIGYIINESAIAGFDHTNIIAEKNGKAIAEGVLQVAEETNRNGRIYPKSELFPQLQAPRTLELLEAGYLRAELGHPLSKDLARQQTIDDSRTCAMFLKLWTKGNEVWGQFRGTNNEFGRVFDLDLKDGCKPAWSLRALGRLEKSPRGMEVRGLRVITWDQVIYPSHRSAYTRSMVTEAVNTHYGNRVLTESADVFERSKEKIIPIRNDDVISYIRSESTNLKYIENFFDFAYDNVDVNRESGTVTLTCNDGNILIINLESYIHNEIMDYCSSSYLA